MNTSEKSIVEVIAELKMIFPDWRTGQMVANLIELAGQSSDTALWDVEDEDLITAGIRLIERNKHRLQNADKTPAAV